MSKRILYLLFAVVAASVISFIFYSARKKRPFVSRINPDMGIEKVSAYTTVSATILKLSADGLDEKTLSNKSFFLVDQKTGKHVPASVRVMKKNIITLIPDAPLQLNTAYTVKITGSLKDLGGSSVIPYSSTFTTASVPGTELKNVCFEKHSLQSTSGRHTTLTIGPDHKLYALSLEGLIKRFPILADGTLGEPEEIYTLQDAYGSRQQRLAIGLTFDPTSTATNLIAYVTHCTMTLSDGPDWDGKLSRLSGPRLQHFQDILIDLPRSSGDHLTNSIAFGPDGALYFPQGSTTAMGKADKTWKFRDEHLLSAAILRLDLKKLGKLPLNVRTKEGGGSYDPFAPGAPLTIYATGIRNSYDLQWHSNGSLYVPTNGSSPGGNTPASISGTVRTDGKPYAGPNVPQLNNVRQSQHDFLYAVEKGGYYGHPNPLRGEYVLNGGNPTHAIDPAQVDKYPVGTMPDPNWRGIAFDFQDHKSPNGIIEYRSNAFNGALKGKLLIARFSTSNDIAVLTPDATSSKILSYADGSSIEGLSGVLMPLDLTEDTLTGNLYVAEFAGSCITLLKPKIPHRDLVAQTDSTNQTATYRKRVKATASGR